MSTNDEVIPGLSGIYDGHYRTTIELLLKRREQLTNPDDSLYLIEHIAHAVALAKISLEQLTHIERMLQTLSIALEELNKKTPPVSIRNDKDR